MPAAATATGVVVSRHGTKRPRRAAAALPPVGAPALVPHKRRRRRKRHAAGTSAVMAEDEDEDGSAAAAMDPSTAHQQLLQCFATSRQPVVAEETETEDVERVTDSAADSGGREEKVQVDDDEAEQQQQHDDDADAEASERKEEAEEAEEEDDLDSGAAEDDTDVDAGQLDDDDDEEADDAPTASSSSSSSRHPALLPSSDPFVSRFSHHRLLPAAVIAALTTTSSDPSANQLQPLPSFSTLKERVFGLNIQLLRDAESEQDRKAAGSASSTQSSEPKQGETTTDNTVEAESAEAALSLPSASSPLHLRDLHVRPKVIAQWLPIAAQHRARQRRQQSRQLQSGAEPLPSDDDLPHPLHRVLFPLLASYRDVVFPSVSPASRSSIVQCYCLHVVNHVVKSRDSVLRHSARLSEWRRRQEEREEQEREERRRQREQDRLNNVPRQRRRRKVHGKEVDSELPAAAPLPPPPSPPEYRDQGFTRCKVLILLPYANAAYTVISTILSLLPAASTQTVVNRKRFLHEFAPDPDVAPPDASRPADYRALFTGQLNDAFRIGISVGNSSVRLYSHFHASDIVVASPLGLRVITQEAAAPGEKKSAAAAAADFLSSVELLLLDGADVLSMQNWAHVDAVLPLLNRLPVSDNAEHPTDFSRVREYLLNGHSALYRQTLVFSRILNSDIAHLARQALHNYAGLLLFRPSYAGQLQSVRLSAASHRQIFQRFPASYLTQHDDRYAAFMDDILPAFRRAHEADKHTLVFIPSYLDFVRLRNHFHARHLSYAAISEYSRTADLSRNRSNFFHGRISFLLMTERFHFYRRYAIRGIRHVLFYQLPQTPDFYAEIVNMIGTEGGAGGGGQGAGQEAEAAGPARRGMVLSLYCEFDGRELERVVGSQRAVRMLEGDKQTYMFS